MISILIKSNRPVTSKETISIHKTLIQLWSLGIFIVEISIPNKRNRPVTWKDTDSIHNFLYFENKRLTRKLEKGHNELCPYAGIWMISCITIHIPLIFDLNIKYDKSVEGNDSV